MTEPATEPATPHILYAAPMTCALAVHAALHRYELDYQLVWLERGPRRQIASPDYAQLNPKRKVPALHLPDGELLTEMVAILAYMDATHGPDRSPTQRRRLLEWLSFLATELHQSVLGPTYDPQSPAAAKQDAADRALPPVLDYLGVELRGRPTLLGGDDPSVADLYLLWAVILLDHSWPERVASSPLAAFKRRMWGLDWIREPVRRQRARFQAQPG